MLRYSGSKIICRPRWREFLTRPSCSTVWIYLFFLPFQLINEFGYYTIPGVAIAAFIYLGFLAAGEEIEQPFGACLLSMFCYHTINHLYLQGTTMSVHRPCSIIVTTVTDESPRMTLILIYSVMRSFAPILSDWSRLLVSMLTYPDLCLIRRPVSALANACHKALGTSPPSAH